MKRAYVIGHPIRHSISPAMHNGAFRHLGIDARYEAVDIVPEQLASWVRAVRGPDLLGFNVTVPHKEAVVPLLAEIAGDAAVAGAVNTVIVGPTGDVENGGSRVDLTGLNTDTIGFRRSLADQAGFSLRGQQVVLLGAGGAARAVAVVALQDQAASLFVTNRHIERARKLLHAVENCNEGVTATSAIALDGAELASAMAEADVIVNATSVGLQSEEMPIDRELIPPGSLVVDLIYNPRDTALLRAARECGAQTLGGLGMLVYQAAAAFEAWTSGAGPIEVMRSAAEESLAEIQRARQ